MSGETLAVVVMCACAAAAVICDVMDRRQMRRQTFKRLDEWCKAHPFDAARGEAGKDKGE